MTRVDFYVLETSAAHEHERMLCRVVEKAWKRGHEVYVQCGDEAAVTSFDEALWRFHDTSFVPHGREGEGAPVVIGTTAANAVNPDVLVNLAAAVPTSASGFQRVIESAGYDDTSRSAARERYRYYQDRGFPLNTHKIGA